MQLKAKVLGSSDPDFAGNSANAAKAKVLGYSDPGFAGNSARSAEAKAMVSSEPGFAMGISVRGSRTTQSSIVSASSVGVPRTLRTSKTQSQDRSGTTTVPKGRDPSQKCPEDPRITMSVQDKSPDKVSRPAERGRRP